MNAPDKFYYTKEEYNLLKEANEFLVKEIRRLEKELAEERRNRENRIKVAIQEKCDHDWGGVDWQCATGGYRTCRKCGNTELYYERD